MEPLDNNERVAKRKELRALLQPYTRSSYAHALSLVALDLSLFGLGSWAVVMIPIITAKLVGSFVIGLAISRMFVLGHDAGHQSLTPSRTLNNFLGRLLFLPSLSPYSLWEAGHNVAHHGFAGLRGRDIPWVPLSPEAYAVLPRFERFLYRVYRSWWGAGIYYGHAVWWKQMYFPKGKNRRAFILDSWLVTLFLLIEVGAYTWAAVVSEQSVAMVLTCGIVIPIVIWLYMAAVVFYVHHTDETARWYDSLDEWRAAQPNLEDTHGTELPLLLDRLLHHALEHTAHHVNAAIPSYRLSAAQRAIEARYPQEVPLRRITIRRYYEITGRCQLYDAKRHQWVTFREVATIPAAAGTAA